MNDIGIEGPAISVSHIKPVEPKTSETLDFDSAVFENQIYWRQREKNPFLKWLKSPN